MTNVNFKMKFEEEIFLYVSYKDQFNYIKISFKSQDQFHLILVKEAISAAFEGFYVDNCDFYWDQVRIPEKDLVKLIKAKQFCGHFRIALKEKCLEIEETPKEISGKCDSIEIENKLKVASVQSEKSKLPLSEKCSEAMVVIPQFLNEEINSDIDSDGFVDEECFNQNPVVEDGPSSTKHLKKNLTAFEYRDHANLNIKLEQLPESSDQFDNESVLENEESTDKAEYIGLSNESEAAQFLDEQDEFDSDSDEPLRKKANVMSGNEYENFTTLLEQSCRIPAINCKNKPKKVSSFLEPFKNQVVKFKEYFNSNVHSRVLMLGDPLTPSNRKNIMNCAVNYLFDEVGFYPDVRERSRLVRILLEVFKQYRQDKELVVRWVNDKVANARRKIKNEQKSISRLLENSMKRKRADIAPEDSDDGGDNDSSYSYTGTPALDATRFKQYISSDTQKYLLIIDEADHTEPTVRKKIIGCAVQFLFNECGVYPGTSQKRGLVHLVIDAFPGLRYDKEQVKKWIQDRILNCRKRAKQIADSYHESLDSFRVLTGELNIDEQMKFLEDCTDIDDIHHIQKVLKDTLPQRIEQNFIVEFNVFNTYKFFSKSLDLILYDFSLRFPSVKENVLDNFELILDAASSIFSSEMKRDVLEYDFSPEIQKFVAVFHYTRTPVGCKKHYSISKMIDSLVSFSTFDEDKKPEFKGYPVIVAQGYSKKDINKYFIQIESSLLELPEHTRFIEAFDYLTKFYYVFNVEFPNELLIFLNFIMINVYDIHVKSKFNTRKSRIDDLPARPREFWRKIQKYINHMK